MTLTSIWHRGHDVLARLSVLTRGSTAPVMAWSNEWSIAIYRGCNPFAFAPHTFASNPVLSRTDVTDVPARFVADPFMVKADDKWHMYFEVMNASSRKGEIGYAASNDGIRWSYQQIVLATPSHMAYPYVFEWMGEFFMIPAISKSDALHLYRASKFPNHWSYCKTLLSGIKVVDASIAQVEGRWWIFADTSCGVKCDTLRLFYSNHLMGPWNEHPKSPIVAANPHIARPGGRVISFEGLVIRYTQDCYPRYGNRLRAFEITELTPTKYREREARENPILSAGEIGAWNAAGMHHIDPHQISSNEWIACVDGHRKVPLKNSISTAGSAALSFST